MGWFGASYVALLPTPLVAVKGHGTCGSRHKHAWTLGIRLYEGQGCAQSPADFCSGFRWQGASGLVHLESMVMSARSQGSWCSSSRLHGVRPRLGQ